LFDQLQKYVSLTSLDQTTIQCNGTMLSVVASMLRGLVLGTKIHVMGFVGARGHSNKTNL
jgi:hypothetical protein